MSVFIPGMEMPKTCYDDCPCQSLHWCNALKEITEPMTGKRIDRCPLVEIKTPHGRLIDGDAIADKCDEPHWCVWLNEIKDAPTIIEAEGGGEE